MNPAGKDRTLSCFEHPAPVAGLWPVATAERLLHLGKARSQDLRSAHLNDPDRPTR
jgi:hypothetical protein